MSGRLLRPSDVPPQLWLASTGTVCLPTSLVDSYIDVLNAHDLFALAQTHEGIKSAIGGLTKEDTEHHLATRFQNSSARALLTVLDPKSDLQNASDLVVHAFAGGDLGLLDIPCGTGVASVTLLSTFAELREQKVLPSEPLTVHMVFGDISPYALAYAEERRESMSTPSTLNGTSLMQMPLQQSSMIGWHTPPIVGTALWCWRISRVSLNNLRSSSRRSLNWGRSSGGLDSVALQSSGSSPRLKMQESSYSLHL